MSSSGLLRSQLASLRERKKHRADEVAAEAEKRKKRKKSKDPTDVIDDEAEGAKKSKKKKKATAAAPLSTLDRVREESATKDFTKQNLKALRRIAKDGKSDTMKKLLKKKLAANKAKR